MAQAVTIRHGDTITRILMSQRGLQWHETHAWISKLRRMNPHISSLDRIYPGESILIPDTLNESIPEAWIWRNAFSKIPQPLRQNHHGGTDIYFAQAGDTIDKVAQNMFSSGPYRTMPASSKRALLLHNNPFLKNHLHTNRIPVNRLINITPAVLSAVEKKHWQLQQSPLKAMMGQMENETRDMFRQAGPETAVTMAQMAAYLKSLGASVGAGDVIQGAGYGLAGVSGHAAAGTMALGEVNGLMRELYREALEKFGPKIVHSKSANHIAKMERFLKGHPNYAQLMRYLNKLPKHLLPEVGMITTNLRTNGAVARRFRKHVSLPLKKWNNSSKYIGSVAKQLNGRLRVFKYLGKGATWYVPATLGLISVATAPPGMKMRKLFEEGFGVVGGAFGTWFGSTIAASSAIGLLTLCGLCLGPFGLFITVFICASAGGIIGMETFKKFGGGVYDYGVQFDGSRIYHSPEQLLEAIP